MCTTQSSWSKLFHNTVMVRFLPLNLFATICYQLLHTYILAFVPHQIWRGQPIVLLLCQFQTCLCLLNLWCSPRLLMIQLNPPPLLHTSVLRALRLVAPWQPWTPWHVVGSLLLADREGVEQNWDNFFIVLWTLFNVVLYTVAMWTFTYHANWL